MTVKRNTLAHILAIVTILIWGTTFVSTKVLLETFTPIEILFLRFILGYVALWIIKPSTLKVNNIKEELMFAAAGICGVTLYFLLENIALTYTFASNVGIIVAVSPIFTAILAHFLLKGEKLNKRIFIGFIVAILGISLVSFNGSYVLKLNPLGDVLAILAALVWSLYSILMKKISFLNYNNIKCTRRVFFYGLIFMLPILPFLGFHVSVEDILNATNLLNIIYLGLGASAACFVIWNFVIGVLGAVKTSVYIYMVPVVTIIFSVIILNESMTFISILGCLLALFGLYISEEKSFIKNKKDFKNHV